MNSHSLLRNLSFGDDGVASTIIDENIDGYFLLNNAILLINPNVYKYMKHKESLKIGVHHEMESIEVEL